MNQKQMLLPVLLLATLSLALTGCGKLGAGKIAGPGPNITAADSLVISGNWHPTRPVPQTRALATSALLGDIDITPVAGDSVYIYGTLADLTNSYNWQEKIFWGLLNADGSIDGSFRRQVPAAGESYTFLPVVHRGGLKIPMIGAWNVNGVPITAVDHSKYEDMFTFRVTRDGTGQAVIDPIRPDFANYGWYKLVVTGVEPDSVQYSKPVDGSNELSFFATQTRLFSLPMIFDGSAWVQYVWAKPGALIILRVNKPDGSMWPSGVYLENVTGQRRLLTNVMDVDDDTTNPYYPVMPAILGTDGLWTVPNPGIDNRWVTIGFGNMVMNNAERQQFIAAAAMAVTSWR